MNLIDVLVAIQILIAFPIGVYIFGGTKVTWPGTKQMVDRYKYHFFLLILITVVKALSRKWEQPMEGFFSIDFTPMIYEFEGNSVFWVQNSLQHPAMTFFMAFVYIGSFLFIMVFSVLIFTYMDMRRIASKLIFLYLVLFLIMIPFYFFVVVYTPSYPKMFYPEANSMVSGMEPLLYNYGPHINKFFMDYDTFNNCFPSMHIGYPAAILFIICMDVKGFRGYKYFLLAMLFLIGLSIIYLGIHWLTDILGGLLFAMLASVIVEYKAYNFWRRIHRLDCWLKRQFKVKKI